MVRILVLGVFSALAAGAQAQVYKCIDAGGKTTYLQSPCPSGAKSASISRTVPAAPAQTEPAAGASGADQAAKAGGAAKATGPKNAAELELDFRKRKQEQEKQREKDEQKLAETKMREENCRISRLQVASLESSVRQLRIDEKGERQFLDEAGIEREKASARKAIEQWCK